MSILQRELTKTLYRYHQNEVAEPLRHAHEVGLFPRALHRLAHLLLNRFFVLIQNDLLRG